MAWVGENMAETIHGLQQCDTCPGEGKWTVTQNNTNTDRCTRDWGACKQRVVTYPPSLAQWPLHVHSAFDGTCVSLSGGQLVERISYMVTKPILNMLVLLDMDQLEYTAPEILFTYPALTFTLPVC